MSKKSVVLYKSIYHRSHKQFFIFSRVAIKPIPSAPPDNKWRSRSYPPRVGEISSLPLPRAPARPRPLRHVIILPSRQRVGVFLSYLISSFIWERRPPADRWSANWITYQLRLTSAGGFSSGPLSNQSCGGGAVPRPVRFRAKETGSWPRRNVCLLIRIDREIKNQLVFHIPREIDMNVKGIAQERSFQTRQQDIS